MMIKQYDSLGDIAYVISGFFSILASVISIHLVFKHLVNYNKPNIQKYIVRILWLVPIYAITSWLSLKYQNQTLYLDAIRDCYEAYALYMFFSLLIAYLQGGEILTEILEQQPKMKHPFPLCFLPQIKPSKQFLIWSKRCILQFVLLKPILALSALILQMNDMYSEGEIHFDKGYIYITILNNLSITLSLYFLVLFYIATEESLKPYNPLPQFLCIKSIVFFSFWQGLGIICLVKFQIIQNTEYMTADYIAMVSQNTLICIEMFALSLAHKRVFGWENYLIILPTSIDSNTLNDNTNIINNNNKNNNNNNNNNNTNNNNPNNNKFLKNLQDVADVTDVIDDTIEVLKPVSPVHSKEH